MPKRIKVDGYKGIFYREADRLGRKGTEKVFYVVYKKNGKVYEEKAGRQFADDMTPAKASGIRADLIENKRLSRAEERRRKKALKATAEGKYTIDKLWNEYKANRAEGKGLSTDANRYENYLKDPFGNKEPHELIKLDVDRLRKKLEKKLSPQTVKHVLNLLTWIINYGVKNNLCQGISFHIKKPTVNNQKTEDLTPEQLQKLLEAIDNDSNTQVATLMKLALFTGLRRGELFKLKWKDIDFQRQFITIRDPKGGKDAQIPMNDTAYDILKNHPRTKGSSYVFPGNKGKQRTSVRWQVNKIKDDAGLPENFRPLHGLRHVYASMIASSGKVDMYTLQKLLTHKSPQMTQRYAHLRDETLKNASNLAGELINEATKKDDDKKVVNITDHQE